MVKTLVTLSTLAVLLTGCGGGGGGSSSSAATDSFIAAVTGIIATAPDNTEPADVEAIAVTAADTVEPVEL